IAVEMRQRGYERGALVSVVKRVIVAYAVKQRRGVEQGVVVLQEAAKAHCAVPIPANTPPAPPSAFAVISPIFAAIRRPMEYRGAEIRTRDLTDPNGARYQAAPRPDARAVSHKLALSPMPVWSPRCQPPPRT